MDIQTGRISTIIRDTPEVMIRDHDVTADGKAFYYVRMERSKDVCPNLLRKFEDGADRELYRGIKADQFRIARSPDGKWLASLNRTANRSLRILPAEGGESREILRFEQKGNWLIEVSWTAAD